MQARKKLVPISMALFSILTMNSVSQAFILGSKQGDKAHEALRDYSREDNSLSNSRPQLGGRAQNYRTHQNISNAMTGGGFVALMGGGFLLATVGVPAGALAIFGSIVLDQDIASSKGVQRHDLRQDLQENIDAGLLSTAEAEEIMTESSRLESQGKAAALSVAALQKALQQTKSFDQGIALLSESSGVSPVAIRYMANKLGAQ